MKTKIIILIVLVLLTLTLIAWQFAQPSVGPHGGSLREAGKYKVEMKTIYPFFYAYLLDESLNPISNKNVFCEMRCILPDETDTRVVMSAYRDDGFSVELGTLEFYAYSVYFTIKGETVTAKFENESQIAKKK